MKQNIKDDIFSEIVFVTLKGIKLRAKKIKPVIGSGSLKKPTLVFLHEGLGCIKLWRSFPEMLCLSTGCSGLVYERRGYGGSEKPDTPWRYDYLENESCKHLFLLLKALDIEDAILIGHSDGGTIALIAAALYKKPVRAIITEAAHIFVEDVTLAGIQKAVEKYKNSSFKEKLARYHGENTDMVFNRWATRWLSPEFSKWNIEKYLPRITCPALIIQGEKDEYGTSAQVEGIEEQVSGPVEVRLIPGCGHIPHLEAEDRVLSEMTRFILNQKVGSKP